MTMSNRSAKFVSALVASILAGTNFAAMAQNTAKEDSAKETNAKETNAKTADTCLSGPKGALPAGGHWYYRVDRATKRNCWYIGEEKDKSARIAPKDSTASAAAPACITRPCSWSTRPDIGRGCGMPPAKLAAC